jgi:hypothetical protein
MTPILGILASGISGNLWQPGKDYDSIATVTLGSNGSTITFSSIPSTYRHLQVRGTLNNTGTDAALVTFNGDSGANYARHRLAGNGSATNASGGGSQNNFYINSYVGFLSTASVFSPMILDILDYKETTKYKTARALSGGENNSSGGVELNSGLWQNTAAVTSITFTSSTGNWLAGSTLALYGIK